MARNHGLKQRPQLGCARHCYEEVGDPDDVCIRLYSMESKDIQDVYLQGLIDTMDIARRRPRLNYLNSKKKSASFKYHVMVGHQRIGVCLTACLSLQRIKVKRVRRLRELAILGESP
ncbi:hypothetical protein ANN_22353 [Periplaneta americana]|uniref:Uncharacterized protein n=1 Tax=Periplaneta americana TaxID=6978 RepID=A0ABQ8S863_PERAM|nr:hypothetical protein ANN_22353 [Periplaneta americana]